MRGINTVCLGGNLVRDAELKSSRAGNPILNFVIAVSESQRQDDGTWQDYPNFVDCVMYGNRAEKIAGYLTKGVGAVVQGRIHQQRWQSRDGDNRSKIVVTVDEIKFDRREQQAHGAYWDDEVPFD